MDSQLLTTVDPFKFASMDDEERSEYFLPNGFSMMDYDYAQCEWYYEEEISDRLKAVSTPDPELTLERGTQLPDLKEICKAHGLKVSGKKSELLERVRSVMTDEEILAKYPVIMRPPQKLQDMAIRFDEICRIYENLTIDVGFYDVDLGLMAPALMFQKKNMTPLQIARWAIGEYMHRYLKTTKDDKFMKDWKKEQYAEALANIEKIEKMPLPPKPQ